MSGEFRAGELSAIMGPSGELSFFFVESKKTLTKAFLNRRREELVDEHLGRIQVVVHLYSSF